MVDVLIRDLSEETVAAIDAAAGRAGLSRAAWLRRTLEAQVERRPVSVADLAAFAERAADLGEPDVMRQAWS